MLKSLRSVDEAISRKPPSLLSMLEPGSVEILYFPYNECSILYDLQDILPHHAIELQHQIMQSE
jgi:hypothetical protein